MLEENNLDFGSVQIHKKALADMALAALSDVEGVTPASNDVANRFHKMLGIKSYPGINVVIEKDRQVSIEMKIYVRYGLNIPQIAAQVQDAVRSVIEKMAEINLKQININVQGIERGRL